MRLSRHLLPLVLVATVTVLNGAPAAATSDRPRLIVLTDYFKDPDDKQSMIRFLLNSNEFEVEGLIATSLAIGDGSVRPELLREQIAEYAQVYPVLRQHGRPGHEYPQPASLDRLVKRGAAVVRRPATARNGFKVPFPEGALDSRECGPAENWIGVGKDTEASAHIISVVDRDDPRPVWIIAWGGSMDLAQAIWKVKHTRPPAEAARFVARVRLYQVSWQDTGSVWLWNNVPDLFFIQTAGLNTGIYMEGPLELRDVAWVAKNVIQDHGPLGAGYPAIGAGGGKREKQVKEGDTPSFLHLLAPGLSDPAQPEFGGWGGRFRRFEPGRNFFVPAEDHHPQSTERSRRSRWTVGRWNEAIAHDFAARMDWCVQPVDRANHPPVVHLEGDSSRRVLTRSVAADATVKLSAAGTTDPDRHALSYRWWNYAEAGTLPHPLTLQDADGPVVRFVAPRVSAPATAHLILEVTDAGEPRLTSYRRVVLTITP